MVFPRPEETAILTIDGNEYRDWETVMVRQCMKDHPYFHFRFTCSEGMPLAKNWAAMRIIPGQLCTVTLAGNLAITGFVNTRQAFYDVRRHYVEIQGSSNVMSLAQSSAVTKTGEFKDVTFKQYANALLKPFPAIQFLQKGQIPDTKFPRISISPGTSVIEAIEEPLRSLGSVDLTSNEKGDLVASGEGGKEETDDTVVEDGDDNVPRASRILEGREILYNPGMAKGVYLIGQRPGDNQTWGAKAAFDNFHMTSFDSLAPGYAPQVAPLEIPAWQKSFLQGRAEAGRDWQVQDEVTVFVTVQGWLRPSGGLWKPRQSVIVISPMLIMDGEGLELETKSVTFTQDNNTGTRTVLEICNSRALAGDIPQSSGIGQ